MIDMPIELQLWGYIGHHKGFRLDAERSAQSPDEAAWRRWLEVLVTNSFGHIIAEVERSMPGAAPAEQLQQADARSQTVFDPPDFNALTGDSTLQALCRQYWPAFHNFWSAVNGEHARMAEQLKGAQLTAEQKAHNRRVAQLRVVVEHIIASIKRCRIVKDTIRLWKEGVRNYVCRTASDSLLTVQHTTITMRDLAVTRGTAVGVEQVALTAAQYGLVGVIAVWDAAYEAPIYLVTSHSDLDQAVLLYRRRAQIETFFSDQKSRGFRLDRSHLSDPKRVACLMIASVLAYLWMVYLGALARRDRDRKRFVRTDRCDLSLFSLGLRFVAYCLRHRRPIPTGGPMPLHGARQQPLACSVR